MRFIDRFNLKRLTLCGFIVYVCSLILSDCIIKILNIAVLLFDIHSRFALNLLYIFAICVATLCSIAVISYIYFSSERANFISGVILGVYAVVISDMLDNASAILINAYRIAVDDMLIAIPFGLLDILIGAIGAGFAMGCVGLVIQILKPRLSSRV